MASSTQYVPITHDFLAFIVDPGTASDKIADSAEHFIQELKDAPALTSHRVLQGRDEREVELVCRIIEYRSQVKAEPNAQAGLDWKCLEYWVDRQQVDVLNRIRQDGRFKAVFKENFQSLMGCGAPIQTIVRELDRMMGVATYNLSAEAQREWMHWRLTVERRINEIVFHVYWKEALQQQAVSLGSCLVNLDRLVAMTTTRESIYALYDKSREFYNTQCKREDSIRLLHIALKKLRPLVFPEFSSEEIKTLVQVCSRLWDEMGEMNQEARIWMYAFIQHLFLLSKSELNEEVKSYVLNLIYLIREMADCGEYPDKAWIACNRIAMMYLRFVFRENTTTRLDLIVMEWMHNFLMKPIDQFMESLPLQDGSLDIMSLDIFKDHGFIRYACDHCPEIRMHYELGCTSELLKKRLECWLSGDLSRPLSVQSFDLSAIRIQLSKYINRELEDLEFQSIVPCIQSLRYLLASYTGVRGYNQLEIRILHRIFTMQLEGATDEDKQILISDIINLAVSFQCKYVDDQMAGVLSKLILEALRAGILSLMDNPGEAWVATQRS